jgi:L-2-hydroxyglutarate oxidase LhgO
MQVDHLVIGAGAVGLAISRRLAARSSTLLLEQHARVGQETSTRNSQVIHSGFYYPIQSLKTKLCIRGRELLYEYLKTKSVPHKKVTKWVVAQQENQMEKLNELYKQAKYLNVPVDFQSKARSQEMEPWILAEAALVFHETGIFDAYRYMNEMLYDIQEMGGDIVYQAQVTHLQRVGHEFEVQIKQGSDTYSVNAKTVINAAGLHSEKVANMLSGIVVPKLYYCKGHYYGTHKKIAKRLIYPVPCKNLTSLGLHLTVDLNGACRFGPDVHYQDTLDYSFTGNLETAAKEIASYVKGRVECETI